MWMAEARLGESERLGMSHGSLQLNDEAAVTRCFQTAPGLVICTSVCDADDDGDELACIASWMLYASAFFPPFPSVVTAKAGDVFLITKAKSISWASAVASLPSTLGNVVLARPQCRVSLLSPTALRRPRCKRRVSTDTTHAAPKSSPSLPCMFS